MVPFQIESLKSFWQRIGEYLFGRTAPVRVGTRSR